MNHLSKIYDKYHQWLTSDKGGEIYSAVTVKVYLQTIKQFLSLLEKFYVTKLNDVTEELLHKFIYFKPNKKPYAAASVTQRLAALDLFFTWTYEHGLSRNNPIFTHKKSKLRPRSIQHRMSKQEKNLPNILTQPEQQRLLATLTANTTVEIRDACIISLLLASPLYAEELITLTPNNINIHDNYALIKNDDGSNRQVYLNNSTCKIYYQNWLKLRQKLIRGQKVSLLFFSSNFKPLSKALLYQQVSSYIAKADLKKQQKGPDLLRQTAIYNMLQSGKSIEEVGESTGHKYLVSTQRYQI